ncbi:hypothetical protein EVAR_45707_1 [Eumeta japonica]|uniref:Uncharacterized protein n=1 Tax=Eumeta variegata TaxID=151549 RepID=A0A4C1WZA2_EUMVA|nr:hypothetical protein EVAR_45707_1 [Eumeta japonica]
MSERPWEVVVHYFSHSSIYSTPSIEYHLPFRSSLQRTSDSSGVVNIHRHRKPVGRAAAPPARPRGVQVSVYISVNRNVSRETHAADGPSVYLAYPFITTSTSLVTPVRHDGRKEAR